MITDILSNISILRQKILCNANIVIYIAGDDIGTYNGSSPRYNLPVPLQYNIITNDDELLDYLQNAEIRRHVHKFRYFLNMGCKLYLASIDNNTVGHYWVADLSKFKPYLYTKSQLFDGNVARYFIFFCKTFENYRNLGIYSYMLTQICKDPHLHDGKVMISTDLTNFASRRGIEKAGFRIFFTLRYLNIGGVKLIDNIKKIEGY